MSKLRIAVVAMVIAAGSFATFAFTNSNEQQNNSEAEFQTHFYGNRGGGQYELLTSPPNPENCQTTDPNPCIVSSQELLEEGFNWVERPEDTNPESTSNAIYTGS